MRNTEPTPERWPPTPEEVRAFMRWARSVPEWAEQDARAAAELAAGQGMNLRELRRSLGLPDEAPCDVDNPPAND